MKAAIFNPYLDTLGGGERYTMAVATVLTKKGYSVDIQWKDDSISKQLENRFEIDLSGVKFIADIKRGDGYDVCFWVSDGSIPALMARKNFLHFQFPFRDVNGSTLLNRMKLFRVNKVICNSRFTQKFIDEEYGVKSIVLHPPVDTAKFKPKKKEKLITYIGRFSQLTQSKRQDILIEVFKKFYDKGDYSDTGNRGWKMILAGGVEVGVGDYVGQLRKSAEGYPIRIIESPKFKDLVDILGRAKMFWSASGFGESEEKDPIKVEHFGITLVEAMSAGCVPLVYNAGGHKEIIDDQQNGFLWEKTSELFDMSTRVAKDNKLLKEVADQAQKNSEKYSYKKFESEFLALI